MQFRINILTKLCCPCNSAKRLALNNCNSSSSILFSSFRAEAVKKKNKVVWQLLVVFSKIARQFKK